MKTSILIFMIVLPLSSIIYSQTTVDFTGPELLGRPTDHSITLNVVSSKTTEAYVEYGTSSNSYAGKTSTASQAANKPLSILVSGLTSDTKYYYRLVYSSDGGATWLERNEHSFHTQRHSGDTFKFDITSDSHVNIVFGIPSYWQKTLSNVAGDNPDFLLDCGDTFAMDNVSSQSGADSSYLFQRSASYFGGIPSVPVFIVAGNHEQQEAWHLVDYGDSVTSPPVWGTNSEKKYFPNPVPDSFYSGDTSKFIGLDGDQLREDYYAWTWGDALFIAIDPFWFTYTKPFIGDIGGGESSEVGSGDRWNWTLGDAQYFWLKQTLENSNAKYKFLFMHHMTGGTQDYIRGGAYAAIYCEWGGYNTDGLTYGFTTRRPVWPEPIHQLLIDNHVSDVFHGHDHQFAYEKRDGVVYQSLPAAGFSGNGFNVYSQSNALTLKVLPSGGHLRVTVSPDSATVDYVNSQTGNVVYSYSIAPYESGLAVELSDFTANILTNGIRLNWMTATEVNNIGFDVERTTDNSTWTKIGFVSGNGNSNSPKNYTYVDSTVENGEYSYRLKQIDNDGKFDYSKSVIVALGVSNDYRLSQNFPNPFNPTTLINYSVPTGSFITIKVYDILGREIATLVNEQKSPGNYEVQFNASKLSGGVYFYRMQAGEFMQAKKLVLMK